MLTRSTPVEPPTATAAAPRPVPAVGATFAGRRLTRLLAATDGAPESEAALVLGWSIARRAGAALEVMTAYEPLPDPDADFPPPADGPTLEQMLRDDLRQRVEHQLVHAGVPASEGLIVRRGHPGDAILRIAEETGAQLIVVGLRPHGIVQRVLGPETVLHLARSARVPMLAVPSRLRWLPPRAVVAVDFSDSSVRAAQAAIDLLGGGGRVMLAHVAPRSTIPLAEPSSWEAATASALADRFRSLVMQLAIPAGMHVETITLRGSAGAEVLSLARRSSAELIAVGSHARSAVGRVLLGSVSTDVLRRAACSVLVAPARPK